MLTSNLTLFNSVISRPYDKDFLEWVKNDSNVVEVREALSQYPDLVSVKDKVRNYNNITTKYL